MLATIKTALISVSDKTGLVPFAEFLANRGVTIISTGGTAALLEQNGVKVTAIDAVTNFPEMMDGRVKTLHPKIHGGILALRNKKSHQDALKNHAINPIDLVVVNLYPFEEQLKKSADAETMIENIDIGGPSMIRSAAKNHEFVTLATSPNDYAEIQKAMEENNNATSMELRKQLAHRAFCMTASYDSIISRWLGNEVNAHLPERISFSGTKKGVLRYGENPAQAAAFYTDGSSTPSVATAECIQGKELSFNNIADADAAFELVSEFTAPTVAIIKHANPCGVASSSTLKDAYLKALACDPVSAYGSIIAMNKELDDEFVNAIGKLFVEVIIAPSVSEDAKNILKTKKNLRVLVTSGMPDPARKTHVVKSVSGGFLVQERDFQSVDPIDLKVVSKRKPNHQEMEDLMFAMKVCKHVKSNAIVLAKDKSTLGIGSGQTSRVDATHIAIWKATETSENEAGPKGCVLASEAFLPFSDNVNSAAEAGITAIIQPGGSIRDQEVIDAADANHMVMVFSGKRHFKH